MNTLKKLSYYLVDLVTLSRGVKRTIGDEIIRFPAKWSRYYEANYEPETFKFFRENLREGNVILDIGAHIGLFSVVTSRIVGEKGRVFAFEPTPFTRGVLAQVVSLNGCDDNVDVRPEAVAEKDGVTVFFDTGSEVSNANSLVKTERSKIEFEVPIVTVDSFSKRNNIRVDCLKIDVEGAEYDLLLGAKFTMKDHRPVARLGLHPQSMAARGHSLEMIWELIGDYRYSVSFEGAVMSKEDFCSNDNLFDVNLFPLE